MDKTEWLARVEHAYAGRLLTCLHARIAGHLAEYLPDPFPAQATLAAAARCSVRSVRRALTRLRDLGLLTWEPRRASDPESTWATRRTSNRYTLRLGAPVAALVRALRSSGQRVLRTGRKEERQRSREAQLAALGEVPPVRTLAEIAQSREAARLEAWQRREPTFYRSARITV